MITNQLPPSTTWNTGGYTELLANVKSEPQSYGQYGCHYPQEIRQSAAPLTPQISCSSSADELLDEELKDIKLEDLCHLTSEVSDVALQDARFCDQLRNSTSPESFCSSDLECGGSPASSTAESWLSSGSSGDHMVPSPQHTPNYPMKEEKRLYVETALKPPIVPTHHYQHVQQRPVHSGYNYQHPYHYPRYAA